MSRFVEKDRNFNCVGGASRGDIATGFADPSYKGASRGDAQLFPSLRPFTQQGLTNALLLIGTLSIWSLMMLETGFRQMMWIIGGATLVGAVLALLSPVHGVHKRIVLSKEEELSKVTAKISKLRDSFQNSDVDRRGGEMADLVAYRGLVESVPEWPFTTSTYTRIILYALLPILTWSIGLFAEEIVGRILLQ